MAELEVKGANAAAVIDASRKQIASLRADKASLQETAQQLSAALADRDREVQALAKRNGELG